LYRGVTKSLLATNKFEVEDLWLVASSVDVEDLWLVASSVDVEERSLLLWSR
jgi:hypothetical protein